MPLYDKAPGRNKALSIKEQINKLLHETGLHIENEQSAYFILEQINYYRLMDYAENLKTDAASPKVDAEFSLEVLYDIYKFDCALRNLLLLILEHIEIELKTKIAYHLGMKYGAKALFSPAFFDDIRTASGQSVYHTLIQKLKSGVHKSKEHKQGHKKREIYDYPILELINFFTFGMLSSLFTLMKREDENALAREYGSDSKHLKSWILSLLEVRNICAHYGRLYSYQLSQKPKLYKEHKKYDNKDHSSLFLILLVMRRMLVKPKDDNPLNQNWKNYHASLVAIVKEHQSIDLDLIGFPENWKDVLQ